MSTSDPCGFLIEPKRSGESQIAVTLHHDF